MDGMLAANIEAQIVHEPDGCWVWTGRVGSAGYPQIHKTYINRLAYEDANGPIPLGHRLERSCSKLRCVNPGHRTPKPVRNAAFWSYVDQSAGPNACWPWIGKVKDTGYPFVLVDGRASSGHRRAYELAKGAIPPGMMVLHSCDNPRCCNPAHLRVGDYVANVRDAVSRGRHVSPFSRAWRAAHPKP